MFKMPERVRDWWPLLILAFLFCVFFFYPEWQHWLSHSTGSYNCTPTTCPNGVVHNYNAFSGSISDVGEYTIAVGMFSNVAVVWRAHTCHMHWWCWRHAAHVLDGTEYKLCHVHHPDEKHNVKKAVARYQEIKAA